MRGLMVALQGRSAGLIRAKSTERAVQTQSAGRKPKAAPANRTGLRSSDETCDLITVNSGTTSGGIIPS
jgi:hypothetical protein